MKHSMRLRPEPFEQIRSGKKVYELRLFDEKRQQIKPGDEIEFTCTENADEKFIVKVIALHLFASFKELYATLPLDKCGYDTNSVASASPSDMEKYYSTDEQSRYGVVGIELTPLSEKSERT